MENTEKFIDLIQGNLSEDGERTFFSELSQNDEMRQEYKCFISITDTINRSVESFSPSGALKSRVFAAAGMAVPNQPVNPAAVPSADASRNSRLTSNIITGTAASVITFLLMFLLFWGNRAPSGINDNNRETSNKTTSPSSTERATTEAPVTKEIIKYVYVNKHEKSQNINTSSEAPMPASNEKASPMPVLSGTSQSYGTINAFSSNRTFQSIPISDNFKYSPAKTGLDVEFKSSTNWNIPRETIDPSVYSKLNNFDLTVLYGLNDHLKVGGSLKEETFYTVYTGTDNQGSLYRYYQQPNFLTFCLDARYYPFAGLTFEPFVQFGIGANAGGWVLRPSIGFEYYTNNDISLLLGIEYSYFNFMHQSNRFSTQKFGINYGIAYHF